MKKGVKVHTYFFSETSQRSSVPQGRRRAPAGYPSKELLPFLGIWTDRKGHACYPSNGILPFQRYWKEGTMMVTPAIFYPFTGGTKEMME